MKVLSAIVSFLQRQHPRVPFVCAAVLIFALINVAAQTRARYVRSPQDKAAPSRGAGQLQTAAANNSEAELQRVENSYPGTSDAALARLLRGYLRLQAKDYSTAATL